MLAVRDQSETVNHIDFLPTDSNLRCKGFPKFDPLSEYYSPFQAFGIKDPSSWDTGLLYSTIAHVRDLPNRRGYIFVYCKKGQEQQCKVLKKHIDQEVKMDIPDRERPGKGCSGRISEHCADRGFLTSRHLSPGAADANVSI